MIEVVRDDMNYISKIPVHIKRGIENIKLNSVFQNRRKTPHVLMSPFKKCFKEVVSEYWELPSQEIDFSWDDLDEINVFSPLTDEAQRKFAENRRKATRHSIQMDVTKIMVKIPRDLVLTGGEERVV